MGTDSRQTTAKDSNEECENLFDFQLISFKSRTINPREGMEVLKPQVVAFHIFHEK